MNIDFHYYVTYLAALRAGFKEEESLLIAHAAQYVDDSTPDMVENKLLPGLASPIPTVEESFFFKEIKHSTSDFQKSEVIWETFHFLPGNIPVQGKNPQVYEGVLVNGLASYEEREKREFNMMCLPNSPLSEVLVNDCKSYKGHPYFLHLLGMRMHTLADTWAHMYYSGVCSWWVNDVKEDVYWFDGGKVIFGADTDGLTAKHWYKCTPVSPYYQSYLYLGHGRMGHLPDEPFARYRYKPIWRAKAIDKDNPQDFMTAYKQMVYAMACVKNDNNYAAGDPAPRVTIDGREEAALRAAFENDDYTSDTAIKLWADYIKNIVGHDVTPYDKSLWLNAAREAEKTKKNLKTTDYYYFNQAAALQRDFVERQLGPMRVYPKS